MTASDCPRDSNLVMNPLERASESTLFINSNTSQYTQRQSTQEHYKLIEEDLHTKLCQLRIYETKYAHSKKEISKWKKKFDYVFRENELLSVENAKIDACHKQIAYLQQELTFKEEECQALRELVTALEQAHKKARAARKQQNTKNRLGRTNVSTSGALESVHESATSAESGGSEDAVLSDCAHQNSVSDAKKSIEHDDDKVRLEAELVTLKSENSYLLSSLDRKMVQLRLKEEQTEAHKKRIETLESLQNEQQTHSIETLKQKQEDVVSLKSLIQRYETQLKENGIALCKVTKVQHDCNMEKDASQSENDDATRYSASDSHYTGENVTPPGTPPPLSKNVWNFPLENDDGRDQIVRSWEPIKNICSTATTSLDESQLEAFVSNLPHQSQDATRRILSSILNNTETDRTLENAAPETETNDAEKDLELIIRSIPSDSEKILQNTIVPVIKNRKQYRCTYSTMQRRTLVTDARILLEKRDAMYIHSSDSSETTDEPIIGTNHTFLGPSLDDISKLVTHTTRVISHLNRAAFISEPEPHQQNASDNVTATITPPDDTDPRVSDEALTQERLVKEQSDRKKIFDVSKHVRGRTKQLMGSVVAKGKRVVVATAKSMQNYTHSEKYVHQGSCCQFCLTNPITGPRYECATCHGVEMCETCYGLGFHGLENSDALFIKAQTLILGRCSRLQNEVPFLELLRFEICRNNFRKFQFCIHWVADILNGKSSKDLQARALEIPNIRRDVRKQFVPVLMRLVSNREDLEVKTEWELENDNAASVKSIRGTGTVSDGDGNFLETLRIWVADQYKTTSPFVERSISKYREDYEVAHSSNVMIGSEDDVIQSDEPVGTDVEEKEDEK